jgi:hypothetical protein
VRGRSARARRPAAHRAPDFAATLVAMHATFRYFFATKVPAALLVLALSVAR